MEFLIVLLVPSPDQKCGVRLVTIDFPDSEPFPLSLRIFMIFKND